MTHVWQPLSGDLAMLFLYNQGFVVDVFSKRLNTEDVKRGVYYHADDALPVVYDSARSITLGDRQLVGRPAYYDLERIATESWNESRDVLQMEAALNQKPRSEPGLSIV